MNESPPPVDFGEFTASFLVEAEEHLQFIEHATLDLEGDLGRGAPEPERLRELFRAIHTIKGLAAMLEFEPIVEITHRLESLLRALERNHLPFTSETVDALIAGTRVLASLIAGVQARRHLVAPTATLDRLDVLLETVRDLSSPSNATTSAPGSPPESAVPRDGGQRRYEIRFRPSPELVERGISITVVREALGRLGQVLGVQPEVVPGDAVGIVFVIQLLTAESPAGIADATGLPVEMIRPVPEPGGATEASDHRERVARSSVVRVDIARLDELMRLVGELVISRSSISRTVSEMERLSARDAAYSLQEATSRLDRHLRDLREAVMRVRMVPIREAFGRMPLVLRDSARASGKLARIELEGEDTEVDKVLVDRLIDPLLHLVRNAVDHGIEPPAVRRAEGKPEVGLVRLAAHAEGDRVVVEVRDDGAGIDRERVAAKAAALGFDPRSARDSNDALLQVLCQAGLSTRDQVGRVSGRGVGLDVVRERVQEMNGDLELDTAPGRGTTFTLRLPLTLAIVEALTTVAGGQRFAFPILAVDEVAELDHRAIVEFDGNEIVHHRGAVLPLLRLDRALHLPSTPNDRPYLHALIASVGGHRWAIGVDRVIGEQGVVVKTLADGLVRTPGVIGATDLGDGELVLILDIPEIVRARRERSNRDQSEQCAGERL